MRLVGDLQKYTQFQAANAMEQAANNPSGMAGGAMGMGMGFAMANQMGQAMGTQQGQGATPPPLPQSVKYYAALGGQQAGPFDVTTLQQHINSGHLTKQTLVWREGMSTWIPAEQVTEIKNLFNAIPPPLPS